MCFLCEESPCSCGKPSRAPARPRSMPAAATTTLPVAQPATPPARPMGLPKLKAPPAPTPVAAKPKLGKLNEVIDEEEMTFRKALTAIVEVFEIPLEDLIRERHRILLPKWKIDAMIWKATRG